MATKTKTETEPTLATGPEMATLTIGKAKVDIALTEQDGNGVYLMSADGLQTAVDATIPLVREYAKASDKVRSTTREICKQLMAVAVQFRNNGLPVVNRSKLPDAYREVEAAILDAAIPVPAAKPDGSNAAAVDLAEQRRRDYAAAVKTEINQNAAEDAIVRWCRLNVQPSLTAEQVESLDHRGGHNGATRKLLVASAPDHLRQLITDVYAVNGLTAPQNLGGTKAKRNPGTTASSDTAGSSPKANLDAAISRLGSGTLALHDAASGIAALTLANLAAVIAAHSGEVTERAAAVKDLGAAKVACHLAGRILDGKATASELDTAAKLTADLVPTPDDGVTTGAEQDSETETADAAAIAATLTA